MSTVPLAKKTLKKPLPTRNIIINHSKCESKAVEKHILGTLVKCRDALYDPLFKPEILDKNLKGKESNIKAAYIVSQIMTNCPKEMQDLNCTVFFLAKGGGYQYWGNFKNFISLSFGDDVVVIILN